MTPSPSAPNQGEGRGSFSARFAPPATAGRELFCWCIGIQLLVLLLSFAGSPASLAVRNSVAAASAEMLIPITELSPSSDTSTTEPSTGGESVPAPEASQQENLTELPEEVTAVAVEEVPMPDVAPAEIMEPLPEPVVPAPRVQETPRSVPVVARMNPRSPGPAAIDPSPRPAPPGPAPSTPAATGGTSSGRGGNTGSAQLFSGAGTGRFPLPPYPVDAKRRGIEGRVMLRVAVASDGSPGVPTIEISSGHSVLDRAALDWIKRRWRWESGPPRLFRIPIIFKLQ